MGSGRISGVILVVIGLALAIAISGWLLAGQGEGRLQTTGLLLGVIFMLVVSLPFLAGGAYMLVKGQAEAKEFAEIEKEKRLLNMVLTQGKVQLANAALEINVSLEQIKRYVYDLVGKGLFSGYVDWKSSTLYAADAAKLGSKICPNCGGERELVGKGTVKCPFCGAELFLPQS